MENVTSMAHNLRKYGTPGGIIRPGEKARHEVSKTALHFRLVKLVEVIMGNRFFLAYFVSCIIWF